MLSMVRYLTSSLVDYLELSWNLVLGEPNLDAMNETYLTSYHVTDLVASRVNDLTIDLPSDLVINLDADVPNASNQDTDCSFPGMSCDYDIN